MNTGVTRVLMLVALLSIATSTPAFDIKPLPGWGTSEQLDRAAAAAARANRPLVLLEAPRSTTCGIVAGRVDDCMVNPAAAAGGRVLIQPDAKTDETPLEYRKASAMLKGSGLLVTTPSFVPLVRIESGANQQQALAAMKPAVEAMRWWSKASERIRTADRQAAAGRYAQALKLCQEIVAEDAEWTAKMNITPPAKASYHRLITDDKEWSKVTGSRMIVTRDGRNFRYASVPVGTDDKCAFFPDLIAAKRGEYDKLITEKIAQAQKLVEQGHGARAARLLEMLIATGPCDLPAFAEAQKLLQSLKPAETQAQAR